MHNTKDIRNDFENFKIKVEKRNISIDLDEIIQLDKENRQFIQKKESLEKEKKDISKKKDKSLFNKSKELSDQINEISKKQKITKSKLDYVLSSIPNLALDDVPEGSDENSNKEILKKGNISQLDFKPKSHYDLG